MEQYDRLENSGRSIGAFAIVIMILLWAGAVGAFFLYTVQLSTVIWLAVCGFLVGILGEAASSTMVALAQHMKDDYVTRKCMEKLIARLERKPTAQEK
ncbi:MAG: hypothetical protein IIY63_04205 [Oscillospiraceae bacterium]|nr:hypothetical protein [Oscillospiraceae bacterium]